MHRNRCFYGMPQAVTKDMGRLQEALNFFESATKDFPFETRSYNGVANVFKKMGRSEESLRAYDSCVKRFPYDIFALSGRADLLKELGRLQDALAAYDVLIRRNPYRANLKHAKAAILVVMHRFKEAETLLPSGAPETRDDWIGYHIRGMILLKTGKLRNALNHFKK